MQAWRSGDVDGRKVSVICDGLQAAEGSLDRELTEQLAAEAATHAGRHTGPQVRAWLARKVIAVNPAAAQRRCERASSKRKITLEPLADGMAELVAYLPAPQARQAFDTVNALAHHSNGPDEARTIDQRRADAFMDLVTDRTQPPSVQVQVTVDTDTLLGVADHPALLAGVGPITAQQARRLFARADPVYRRLITNPVTGDLEGVDPERYRPSPGLEQLIRARDVTCRFPGCRRSALTTRSGTDLDHTAPWPEGKTTEGNLAVLCRHHHRVKHTNGWKVTQSQGGVLTWRTPGDRQITTTPWHYTDPAIEPPTDPAIE
jgi:hypothetical protein